MELDVPFRETGDDGGKSGIQIVYLLKEFLPISYKNIQAFCMKPISWPLNF